MLGIIGRKLGMTQIFDEAGLRIPVTVVEVQPNLVVYTRTKDKQGYDAVAVGSVPMKKSRITKPYAGQFPEGVAPMMKIVEARNVGKKYEVGNEIGMEIFEGAKYVDVSGVTKGKGFAGVVKRHGFMGGKATHGSKHHREQGSTGNNTSPAHTFKGKRMAGHMGNVNLTVLSLRLVKIDSEKKVMLIQGAVPGANHGLVYVTRAKKVKK
jgi:large subunit ribosomal protein L3